MMHITGSPEAAVGPITVNQPRLLDVAFDVCFCAFSDTINGTSNLLIFFLIGVCSNSISKKGPFWMSDVKLYPGTKSFFFCFDSVSKMIHLELLLNGEILCQASINHL
jgi:hypothetical protein